jgi:hypothetical protein
MPLHNRHVQVAKNAVISGTTYYPGGSKYYTNWGYRELHLVMRRSAETGSGTLTVTIESFNPVSNLWTPLLDGAGAAIGPVAYAADATDAAGADHECRIGQGVLSGDADETLTTNTTDRWYNQSVPMYFRIKCVSAGTTDTVDIVYYLYV